MTLFLSGFFFITSYREKYFLFCLVLPKLATGREKIAFQFLQHFDACSPQIGSTGSPPASSYLMPLGTSTNMTTMTKLPWKPTARRQALQVQPFFLFFSRWVISHNVAVVLTFSFLCPPVASPTHGGLPVDGARCLSHLSQLGAVRLPPNPPSPIRKAQCYSAFSSGLFHFFPFSFFSSSFPLFFSESRNCSNYSCFLLTPRILESECFSSSPLPPTPPLLHFFPPFPSSSPCLFVCQDFQPYVAALSAAPPPPPPPPSNELLDPPPKPPFADEEEEEEMLLRETCLMSMANKRVVATEVGLSAHQSVGPARRHVTPCRLTLCVCVSRKETTVLLPPLAHSLL